MEKTAIVTGASSGIGRATAIALSKARWNVVLTARNHEGLLTTSKKCPSTSMVLAGDIANEDFVKQLFTRAVDQFGRIDLLFNNAGTSAPAVPIEDMDLALFQHVVNVNLIGPFLCTREAVRIFKEQEPQGGRIINNGSLSAHTPRPHSTPYTSTKHAITGLTKCTALDGRAFNITCTQIDIGNAHTEMAERLAIGALQPDGRIVSEATFDVDHVANTIVYIASLPNDVTMLEVNIMAAKAPYVGRG